MAEQAGNNPNKIKLPSEAELRQLLDNRGREFVVAYAVRCAWRTFPMLGTDGNFDYWQ